VALLLVIALNKIRTRVRFIGGQADVRVTCGWDDTDAVRHALAHLEVDEPIPFMKLIAEEALERMPPHQREIVELRVAGSRSKRSPGESDVEATVERLLQSCRRQLGNVNGG